MLAADEPVKLMAEVVPLSESKIGLAEFPSTPLVLALFRLATLRTPPLRTVRLPVKVLTPESVTPPVFVMMRLLTVPPPFVMAAEIATFPEPPIEAVLPADAVAEIPMLVPPNVVVAVLFTLIVVLAEDAKLLVEALSESKVRF